MGLLDIASRKSIARGIEYYNHGKVRSCTCLAEGIYQGIVQGNSDYNVTINVLHPKQSSCCCSFASDRMVICKHMIALLLSANPETLDVARQKFVYDEDDYYWDDSDYFDDDFVCESSLSELYRARKEEIENLINNADISIIKEYLTSILLNDDKHYVRFKNMLGRDSDFDVDEYKKQIDSITNSYKSYSGYINYRDLVDYSIALEDFINEDVRRLMSSGKFMEAFTVSLYIFKTIADIDLNAKDMDDGSLMTEIYDIWTNIVSRVGHAEQIIIFEELTSCFDGTIVDYSEDYIRGFLIAEFGQDFNDKKRLFIKTQLDKASAHDNNWHQEYQVGNWAMQYIDLLLEDECSQDDIDNFCHEYWNNSRVRNFCIDSYIARGEYEKALVAIDESMILDKNYSGLLASYSSRKKEVFKIQGDMPSYIRQLKFEFINYEYDSLEVYRELKSFYKTEEWSPIRDELLFQLESKTSVNKFYVEDGLFSMLFESVIASDGLYQLFKYDKYLVDNYASQVLTKYSNELEKMARYAGGREYYIQLADILRHMMGIPGGLDIVNDIISRWRVTYKNRPLMQKIIDGI